MFKVGVIGFVQVGVLLLVEWGIIINVVVLGFIEMQMIVVVLFVICEVGWWMNVMSQGGQFVDVVEIIVWFVNFVLNGVIGNIVCVCG